MTSHQKRVLTLSDKIYDLAEVKFDTKESCDLYVDILLEYGFEVERPYLGVEHAFKAIWGTHGPQLGFLAEYDALDGISQEAGVYEPKARKDKSSAHACGHNLLGSALLLSVLDLQKTLRDENKEARLVLFGTPAEESGYAKAILANKGAYNDLDLAFTWHPHYINALWQDRTLAVNALNISFSGQSSHAAMAPELGRSALDACEMMNIGANYLREHVKDDVRIHYAYVNAGGHSPNVVQKEAQLIYFIRSMDQNSLNNTTQRIKTIAQGAALMSETTVIITTDSTCASLLPNTTLSKVVYAHLKPTPYSEEALLEVKNYHPNVSAFTSVEPFRTDGLLYASTDVGDVSQVVPTCQFFLACEPYGTPMHSWQWAANGKSLMAHEGIIKAAKVLHDSALECINHPQIIKEAQAEFTLRKAGNYVQEL